MSLGSYSNFKRAKELANSDFERRNFGKKRKWLLSLDSAFSTCKSHDCQCTPECRGGGPSYQVPPQDFRLRLLMLVWILAASVLSFLHRVRIQNSISLVAPARVSMRLSTWLFSIFTENMLRHRGGDHIADHTVSAISRGPIQRLRSPPSFQNHDTLCTQSLGCAVPKLWLLLSRGPGPPSHLFL